MTIREVCKVSIYSGFIPLFVLILAFLIFSFLNISPTMVYMKKGIGVTLFIRVTVLINEMIDKQSSVHINLEVMISKLFPMD